MADDTDTMKPFPKETARPQAEPFIWLTNDGQALRPAEMDTLHLFHSIRFLWNHTVPPANQLQPFRKWNVSWDAAFREEAMTALGDELEGRVLNELTIQQCDDIKTILAGRKVFDKAARELPVDETAMGDENDLYWGLDQWDLL